MNILCKIYLFMGDDESHLEIKKSIDESVESGKIKHGFTYIVIELNLYESPTESYFHNSVTTTVKIVDNRVVHKEPYK